MLAIAGACFALIQASAGLTPAVFTAAAVGLAAVGIFAVIEPRTSHPMLPLELFRSRQFASATVLALVAYAALGGVIFLFQASQDGVARVRRLGLWLCGAIIDVVASGQDGSWFPGCDDHCRWNVFRGGAARLDHDP